MSKYYVCLDIGGTKILGAIFDKKLKIVHRYKKKTQAQEGLENVEDTIVSVVKELVKGFNIELSDIIAISAGAPGIINNDTGVVLFSPNLPWENYAIKMAIEKRLERPFFIGNDVNLGVLGEWRFGAAKGRKHVAGVFIGTGIGGGLILNGKLYTGHHYKGAEFGHMVLNIEGPSCNCGQRGCLEAFSGKSGMANYISLQVKRGRKTQLAHAVSGGMFKSKELRKAYDAGDTVAIEAVDRSCLYLAVASGNLVNIFSPELIIFGGGIIESMGDIMVPRIVEKVDAYCLRSVRDTVEFKSSDLGDDSILYGALALIMKQEKDNARSESTSIQ